MKKVISLMVAVIMSVMFSLSTVALPSVGYVLVGAKNDGGWSMRHYDGFLKKGKIRGRRRA